MKTKERKNISKKIAEAEYIIHTSDDLEARSRAEQEIMKLSGRVENWEDVAAIDDLVQDYLQNLLDK